MNLGNETEDLPSYEETLETISHKQYILKYPQLFRLCTSDPRLRSRPVSAPEPMLIPPYLAAPYALVPDLVQDDIGTNVLLNNKEAEQQQTRDHWNKEAPPPAYEKTEPNRLEEMYLIPSNPIPFTYDFTFPEDQADRLWWACNREAKDVGEVSEGRPWREFVCVERLIGRMLAEVVRCKKKDLTLGTLVIHGDLDPGLHKLLVFSTVTVIEEYPMRCLAYLGRSAS
ncbi:hypothetical protein BX661DRAFT_183518 [Kickxella alabastrina]|uniref:uncharacterized protein n=1 Tax=Kickxella alabastrina TaxID=61397 RepID=UPI00221ECBA9|nr:uncharacterized protein BX661DRAFT_183518 [Kickxella alabastrina]KAI7826816.1 hypothetical protein BX661DRAFT_183518 [Kickxella alabastrina]